MRALLLTGLATAALALAGCDSRGGAPASQLGANPPLPGQNQYLLPPMDLSPGLCLRSRCAVP